MELVLRSLVFAGLLSMATVAGPAQVTAPVDHLSSELKTYLKLDTAQSRKINALIDDFAAFVDEKLSDYLDLADQIDALRGDSTQDPQAIGLALADPIAAQITIERKIDAKVVETEKAVQALLTTDQKAITAQLTAALKLQPLASDALDAFILSESDIPGRSSTATSSSSVLWLQPVFQKMVAKARRERIKRKQ